MAKFCPQDLAALKKIEVELVNGVITSSFFRAVTSDGVKKYDAYECPHCGKLTFFRKEEETKQKIMVTP